jgi:hypothetical protein
MRKVNEEEFILAVNESKTMNEAAAKLKMPFGTFKRYAIKFGCYTPNQGGKGTSKPCPEHLIVPLQEILEGNYPQYQTYKLKKRLIAEGLKENKCDICGLTEWLGKPLNMELHHIDGDKYNHKLDNLMMICPNCHSQTDTFRAKNKIS